MARNNKSCSKKQHRSNGKHVPENPKSVSATKTTLPDNDNGTQLLISCSTNDGSSHHFWSANLSGRDVSECLSLPSCNKGVDNSCNCYVSELMAGLVCYFNGSNVYVCNPGKKQFRRLPEAGVIELNPKFDPNRSISLPYSYYSFGFAPATNEYKVLHVYGSTQRTNLSRLQDVQCEVYTVKNLSNQPDEATGKVWEKSGYGMPYPYKFWGEGIFVNGAIHWLRLNASGQEIIVAFDVDRELFRSIRVPNYVHSRHNLTRIDEHLALLCPGVKKSTFSELWVLEDYEKLAWTKKGLNFHNRHPHPHNNPKRVLKPISLDNNLVLTPSSLSHNYDLFTIEGSGKFLRTISISDLPLWTGIEGARNMNMKITRHYYLDTSDVDVTTLGQMNLQFGQLGVVTVDCDDTLKGKR